MMLTHCGNNVRNRYSGCVFSVKDIVPVPLRTSRNPDFLLMGWYYHSFYNYGLYRAKDLPAMAFDK